MLWKILANQMSKLKIELDKFLASISATQSLMFQSKTHLTNYKKVTLKRFKDRNSTRPLLASTLIIGDLTGPDDDGWKIIYPTGFDVKVYENEFGASIDLLIRRESMRSVATCYELLESFFWNITTAFLQINPHLILSESKIKDLDKFNGDLRKQLKYYYKSTDNKGVLKLIGKLSGSFNTAKVENTHNIDLNDWYYVLTKVRHSIVHSLFVLDLNDSSFNHNQKKLFSSYFEHTEKDRKATLDMKYDSANDQIVMIAEFGLLIFKCFCIEMKQDWKVLREM